MNLDNLPQSELIEIFKEVIEKQEEQIKRFTNQFHDDIMLDLLIVKLNLDKYLRKNLVPNLNFKEEFGLIDSAVSKLKKSFREIHTSMPELVGIGKALEFYTKEIKSVIPITLTIENRVEKETEALFSHQQFICISKLYTAILNHFILQPGTVLSIVIYSTREGFWFTFKKEGGIVTHIDETIDFLASNFKEIKARLLMLNAEIHCDTNWSKEIKLLIPVKVKRA